MSASPSERKREQRAQVEAWLSYLSPLEQTILRMRYGLCDDDERTYSIIEIGRILGIPRQSVNAKWGAALRRLKQLANGSATIVMRQGQPHIRIHTFKPPTLSTAQEATLMQRARELAAQGLPVTGQRLAEASELSVNHAFAFLQAHREQFPSCRRPRVPQAERFARLEQAYQQLEAQGIPVTYRRLRAATHIGKQAVCDFFHRLWHF